jgi:hypothetical protein
VLIKAFYDGPAMDPKLLSTTGGTINSHGRSEMFFLAQEASATNCSIQFLAVMFCAPSDPMRNIEDASNSRITPSSSNHGRYEKSNDE